MKKCKVCKEPNPNNGPYCSVNCAMEQLKLNVAKKERKHTALRKVELRSRRDWMKLAQQAFNAFIRERDKHKPCICCGLPLGGEDSAGGKFDCGHYRSIGSAPHLRFTETNAHGQRKQCNRWGSGRAIDYRIGLIARIGLESVETLEADQTIKKWTIDDLREIRQRYTQKLKELRKENQSTKWEELKI